MGTKALKKNKDMTNLQKMMYGFCMTSNIMAGAIFGTYIAYFYTDYIGFSAAFVGSLTGICALFDGVSDIVMGWGIDRTHTRWGKVRPWFLIGGIGCGILVWLSYSVPSILSGNITARMVYCVITYFLYRVVAQTIIGVASSTLITVVSSHAEERNVLGLINVAVSLVATMAVSASTLPLVNAMGRTQAAWSKIAGIYAVITLYPFI